MLDNPTVFFGIKLQSVDPKLLRDSEAERKLDPMEEFNLEDQHYILVSEEGEIIILSYNSAELIILIDAEALTEFI